MQELRFSQKQRCMNFKHDCNKRYNTDIQNLHFPLTFSHNFKQVSISNVLNRMNQLSYLSTVM